MKQLVLAICIVLVFELLLSECASPKAPTGGPMDTIPPTLLETSPLAQSINVDTREITLTFDEWVTAERLSSNLIITPNIEIKYKTITKKTKLILKFEEDFPDSTTITFNFFDGVTDIKEKTPAVNLTYVFSTGTYLDSLEVSGNVFDLMEAKPKEKVTIGLYAYTDTLNINKVKPTYFTSSNEEGLFNITNMKGGDYKLVVFTDINRNLLFDASVESYGFLPGIVSLDSNITDLAIPILKINAAELTNISSRSLGNYYDIQYSKGLQTATISEDFSHQLTQKNKSVRIYKPIDFDLADSVQTIVTAVDSLNNSTIDTVFVKFNKNVRKPSEFTSILEPSGSKIETEIDFQLTFTKPVLSLNPTLIAFKKDSTYNLPIDTATAFSWNNTQTQLTFQSSIDTTSYFQLQRDLLRASDTVTVDSLKATKRYQAQNSIKLAIDKGAFISIENDTLAELSKDYSIIQKGQGGVLILNIITDKPSYTIQLINKSFKVLQEFGPTDELKLHNLEPSEYGFRVLIDDNNDGKWSHGNILEDIPPESIYLFPDFTSLRANWEQTLDLTF